MEGESASSEGRCGCKRVASVWTDKVEPEEWMEGGTLRVCPPGDQWPPKLSMEIWSPPERCRRQGPWYKKSGNQPGGEGLPGRAWGRRAGEVGSVGMGSRAQQAGAPVFQQQDPEQIVSVVWLDLPLEDKPVQQLVGHLGQGFPRQIQKDSTCRQWRDELAGPAPPPPSSRLYMQGCRGFTYPW